MQHLCWTWSEPQNYVNCKSSAHFRYTHWKIWHTLPWPHRLGLYSYLIECWLVKASCEWRLRPDWTFSGQVGQCISNSVMCMVSVDNSSVQSCMGREIAVKQTLRCMSERCFKSDWTLLLPKQHAPGSSDEQKDVIDSSTFQTYSLLNYLSLFDIDFLIMCLNISTVSFVLLNGLFQSFVVLSEDDYYLHPI